MSNETHKSMLLLLVNVSKIARLVANSVDSDQTPGTAVPDLGLHCLLNTVVWTSQTPSEILNPLLKCPRSGADAIEMLST